MIFISIRAWTCEPLTDEEIEAYWMTLDKKERLEEIRKLDIIENSTPVFETISYTALLDKEGNLIIFPKTSIIKMDIGPLSYDLTFPKYKIDDFIEIKNDDHRFFWSILFCGFSGIVGTAITGEDIWWKYLIGFTLGGIAGWFYEFII